MGYSGEGEDEEESRAKIGSKEWLKARKRAIIKKSGEEGFQDRAIRIVGSSIAVITMLVMLYGAIGLLSGEGVQELPCETIRKFAHVCFLTEICMSIVSLSCRLPVWPTCERLFSCRPSCYSCI
jgi:hypothetical protein|eukprot:COSAG02_NODE_7008_length_3229_cov_1.658786_2_plen_124_part_00